MIFMRTHFKSLAWFAVCAAALTLAVADTATVEVRDSEPKPVPPNLNRPGSTPSRSGSVQTGKHTSREVRNYTAAIAPFTEKSKCVIIRSSKIDGKTNEQLQEDMAVMYRILQKAIGKRSQEEKVMKMGIPLLTMSGMGARSMYLEDYGVVFTFAVDMPLLPEAAAEKKVADDSDDSNEEWEDAKNDLFGQRRAVKGGHKAGRPFDQGEVDEVKDSIIEALRNGSNIRHLKPNDWITVVVQGKRLDAMSWPVEGDRFRFEVDQSAVFPTDDAVPESTMVLRLKKSDADDLAKKKGEKGSLKNKVSVAVY
jgi:hypothetical protein